MCVKTEHSAIEFKSNGRNSNSLAACKTWVSWDKCHTTLQGCPHFYTCMPPLPSLLTSHYLGFVSFFSDLLPHYRSDGAQKIYGVTLPIFQTLISCHCAIQDWCCQTPRGSHATAADRRASSLWLVYILLVIINRSIVIRFSPSSIYSVFFVVV